MKKDLIAAGFAGGILFGAMQALSNGLVSGVLTGLFFGAGIAVGLHLFVNSKLLRREIELPADMLLPGEQILVTKLANLVVEPKNFGLQDFAFGDFLAAVGMNDKESIGGAIHLTNYRIVFKSHRFNRIRGITSIFLPTIGQLDNRTVFIFRKLAVSTVTAELEFVIADVDSVIEKITHAREQFDPLTLRQLKGFVAEHPEKCGDRLETWDAINQLNDLINLGKKSSFVAGAMINPIGAMGSIFRSELLEKPLAEKWERVFHAADQNRAPLPLKRRSA